MISGGGPSQSIYYTWSPPVSDSRNTIIFCNDFTPGIHVWSIYTVYKPLDCYKFDLEYWYLVQWQVFISEDKLWYVSLR